MKDEIIIKGLSREEIYAKIDDWMDYYNNERYVCDFHKLAPNEYYGWLTSGKWLLGGSAPEPRSLSLLFSKVAGNPLEKTIPPHKTEKRRCNTAALHFAKPCAPLGSPSSVALSCGR